MAVLETLSFKIKIEGLENSKTAVNVAANKIGRIQHLFKELNECIIDLENNLSNIDAKLIPITGEDNAREQQGLGGQEKATGPKAGGVQRKERGQQNET